MWNGPGELTEHVIAWTVPAVPKPLEPQYLSPFASENDFWMVTCSQLIVE